MEAGHIKSLSRLNVSYMVAGPITDTLTLVALQLVRYLFVVA